MSADGGPAGGPAGAFCGHDADVGDDPAFTAAPGGPLAGLRFAVKDIYDLAGRRTGAGNPDWRRSHPPAARTAWPVRALLEAGARLAGKTTCDEMCWSLIGHNAHYGTPANPAAPDRVTGGSSSGSAAAVAAGTVDLALGSDTGGSVRIPASFCGIYGLRPTHGRIPLDDAYPLAPPFDTCGWFAGSAATLARAGAVLLQLGRKAEPVRQLLVAEDALALADPAAQVAFRAAVPRLETAFGVTAGAIVLAPEGLESWMETFRTLQLAAVSRTHGAWVRNQAPAFGPGIRERFAWAETVTEAQVRAETLRRNEIAARLGDRLPPGTLLCLPTAPGPAPRREAGEAELDRLRGRLLTMTGIAGLGGLPELSLPLLRVADAAGEDLPLGLSLIAAAGQDESLLAAAERVAPPVTATG